MIEFGWYAVVGYGRLGPALSFDVLDADGNPLPPEELKRLVEEINAELQEADGNS